MFAAHVADAVKSSGSRVGLTGVPTASRYYFISMLPLRGGFGRGLTIGATQVLGSRVFEGLRSRVWNAAIFLF